MTRLVDTQALLQHDFWYQIGAVKFSISKRFEPATAALLYLFAGALSLGVIKNLPSPIWLGTGLAISYFTHRGLKAGPAIAILSAIVYATKISAWPALAIGTALGVEAAFGAWLLGHLLRSFRGTHHCAILAYALTSALAPLLSAAVATGLLKGSGAFFLQWWIGDAAGILILAPLLTKPWNRDVHDTAAVPVRIFIHALGVAMSLGLLFFQTKIPSLFFLYPVLLLAGEFLSGRDVRLLTVLMASFAILASALHRGPFPYVEGNPFALSHPLFLFSLGMTSLAITAFRRTGSLRFPGTTLVLFWVLGHLATTVVESAEVRQEHQHLEKEAEAAADQIFDHIRAFESTLRGGAGLFVTLDKVSERNWRKYYRNLHLPDATNGLRSISAIFPVRTNGRTQYRVKFVEPSRQARARADLTLDPVRKQALDEARSTNRITTSRKVGILPKKSGFEMYAPIFSETNHHLGWIGGSFDAELFFSSALRNAGSDIDVFIVDADPKQGGQLFYSTTGKDFQPSPRDVKLAVGRGSQPFHVFVRPSSTFFANRNSVTWVAFVAALVALLGGSLTCSVTARSQELKASENRMIAVIDQSPFGMLLFAPDGKVRKVNRAWMELWNLSVKETEDVVLSNYNLLQDPVLIESGITPSIKRAVKGESVAIPPSYYDPSDNKLPGRARWIETYLTPIRSPDNKVEEISLIQIDVTDMMEARELIRQKHLQMQAIQIREHSAIEASRLKSEFLANMSHEIRTPINGIVGMARLLSESQLGEEQSSFANAIVKSSDHLLALVNDILDISKVEAGRIEFEMLPFDLSELIANVRASFEPLIAKKGLTFNVQTTFPPGQCFIGDPSRIQQVLNNLISNAVKFTEEGEIGLEVSVQPEIDAASELTFQVSDAGIGISEDLQKHIFKPFVQGDSSTARRFGGTGLGLAISKRLVEHMRGQLLLESQDGFGSTFTFKIRLKSASAEDVARIQVREPIQAQREDRAKARVLIAEDNAINSEILSRVLQKAGYRADTVANGQEVLSAVHDIRYDMILMDCQMPVMDGYEAARQLRSRGYTLPIIAITAHALKDDAEKCMAAGMSDFLSKPVPEDRLIKTVDKWLTAGTGDILQAHVLLGLENLERDGGAGLIRRLVGMYSESMRKGMDELRLKANSPEADLSKLAHSLKSANANLGAWIPANHLQAIEDEKPVGEELLRRIDELEKAFLDAEAALMEYLRKQEAHGPNPMC